jgi:hypothetical protein
VHSDSFAGRFGATSFVRLLPGFRWRNADVLPILEVAVIIALTAIGLAVRLRGLVVPTRSLWIDEVFSIWLAKLPPRQAIQAIAAIDQHPPLYALLLHFWLLPRADPWWARLSSVLLGTATIPTAALLGRATGGWRLGVIAACLVTFSPELVRYSQEVRMYAMVVLLVFLATFFLVKAIEQASRRYWLGFGVTTLLLIYTHNVTLFLLPAQAAFVFWEARREPAILRSYLVTMTGVGLLWLPWLPILSHQASGVIQRFWTSAPSPGFVGTTILDFLNAFPPPTATSPVWGFRSVRWGYGCCFRCPASSSRVSSAARASTAFSSSRASPFPSRSTSD